MSTTWRKMLQERIESLNDSMYGIITTLSDDELDREFDDGFGTAEGLPFTAWTEKYVYFPIVYDGAEWVGCVPRNPCNIKTEHQGGQ